jgi:hypothetical protein
MAGSDPVPIRREKRMDNWPATFAELIDAAYNTRVKLQRGGPGSVIGTLNWIGKDFVGLETDNGDYVLYNKDAIHSVTTIPGPNNDDDSDGPDEPAAMNTTKDELPPDAGLAEVLGKLQWKYIVQVGHGPESVRGAIAGVQGEMVYVISDSKEMVHIPVDNITMVTLPGVKKNRNRR